MKKYLIILLLMSTALVASADDYMIKGGPTFTRELLDIPASLLAFYIGTNFILQVIKRIISHRLRSKMADKNLPEDIIKQLLQPDEEDLADNTFRSFLVLTGLGVGLLVMYWTAPLGLHSLAWLAFCLALSFLAHFLYLKRRQKSLTN